MAAKQKIARPLRGEVYVVAFDPTLGAEIRKTRPALILQNDIANRSSPITIVAAITAKFDEENDGVRGESHSDRSWFRRSRSVDEEDQPAFSASLLRRASRRR